MSYMSEPLWLRYLPSALRARLVGRVNLYSLVHNSGWLLLDKLVRMLFGLLVGAWIARYLGPSEYGELAYVIAFLAFFQAVAGLGMDGIIVREIARDPACASQIMGTSFTLRLYAGVVCWVVAVAAMVWSNGWQDRSVQLAALAGGVLVFQVADTIDLWFQSQNQSRRTAIVKVVAYLFASALKVCLILLEAPLAAFASVMTVEVVLSSIGLYFAYKKFPCDQRWTYIGSKGVELLRECWPFIVSGVAVMIYMRIDQVMIKNMLGVEALGIYSAMLPIAMAPNFIPMIVSVVLMPILSRLHAEDKSRYRRLLVLTFRVSFYGALLFSVILAMLSEFIIQVLFGSAFERSADVLAVYVFSNCFTWLGVAHSLWLVNEKKGIVRLYGTLAGAVVCVVLNAALIPELGLSGAAVVAIVAQFVSVVGINIFFARESFMLQLEGVLFIKKGV